MQVYIFRIYLPNVHKINTATQKVIIVHLIHVTLFLLDQIMRSRKQKISNT